MERSLLNREQSKIKEKKEEILVERSKRFSWRGWTTFLVTISFIVDTLSGIILYIAPPGRIANWTNWKVWGLSRTEWGAIHTVFGYVLLFIVALHLYYNWTIFWKFIWSRIRKALNLKWELFTSTIVCLFIFVGTIWNIPPFSSTMNLGDYLKESWEEAKADVPLAHAELLSLEEFAAKTGVPLDQITGVLKTKGYKVGNTKQTLGQIAEENGVSPATLYEVVKARGADPKGQNYGQGSGTGRKTVEAICAEIGVPLDEALNRLDKQGISARPADRMKGIAAKADKTPLDILNILEGKEP